MKNFKSLSILMIAVTAFAFSCSDDDEKADARDQAVGTYNYKTKVYYLDGTDLIYLGADYDDSGTFILSKTANGFEVKEGGEVMFNGTKVAEASNGFSFDIASQTVTEDGQTLTIDGYENVALTVGSTSTKYDGGYFKDSKKMESWFKATSDGTTIVLNVTATKI